MAANSSTRFRKRRISEINVVPYIDVMLVLLVIFYGDSAYVDRGVQVELPQTVDKPWLKTRKNRWWFR